MLPVILLMMVGPVGTVSSTEPFTLRGTQVPVAGVPSWPVSGGDEIVAGKAPAMITFRGGSRVYVNAGSRVMLQVDGKQTVLRLMKGDLAYKVSRKSPVGVAALGYEPLPGSTEEGLLQVAADKATWAPAERAADPAIFLQYQMSNPFNTGFITVWRNYLPPFGIPAGTTGPGQVVAPPAYNDFQILPPTSLNKGQAVRNRFMREFLAIAGLLGLAGAASGQAPSISAQGTKNGADYGRAFAPGAIISIFGSNFAAGTTGAPGVPLPTALDGVTVEAVDGSNVTLLPLYLVSPGQINAMLPYNVGSSVQIRVRNAAGVSAGDAITVDPRAPRVFSVDQSGSGRAVMTFSDGGLATRARPAKPGDFAVLWANSLGAVDPPIAAGMGGGVDPFNQVTAPVSVSLSVLPGNAPSSTYQATADVSFAGLAPYFAGLYQINVKLPYWDVVGDVPLTLSVGGVAAQTDISVPVEPNGFYWVIGADQMVNGQTLNAATGTNSSLAFVHTNTGLYGSPGYQDWTKTTQRTYQPVSGLALTLKLGDKFVFDNNGLETGSQGKTYDNRGGGLDDNKPGLWVYASMSNRIQGVWAGFFRLSQATTFDTMIGYFDGDGQDELPFDPGNPFNRWRMNVWKSTTKSGIGVVPDLWTADWRGDAFSSDTTAGVFSYSDTTQKRIFQDGVTDGIFRVVYKLNQPVTLAAGDYWFSHDVAVPETSGAGHTDEDSGFRVDAATDAEGDGEGGSLGSHGFSNMLFLCGVALAWGYAVFRYGGILGEDWQVSLVVLGITGLAWAVWPGRAPRAERPAKTFTWMALALPLVGALQLVPLPPGLIQAIAPLRWETASALGQAGWIPLSVTPEETLDFTMRVAALVLTAVMVRGIAFRLQERVWLVMSPVLGVALLEAVLGIVQAYEAGGDGIAKGTYPNRNHFAGLMEMALPFAVTAAVWQLKRKHSRFESPARPALAACGLLGIAAVLLVAVLHSQSRMGFLATLMSLVFLGTVWVSAHREGWRRWAPGAGMAAAAGLAFVFLPADALIQRFAAIAATDDISADTRAQIWRDTVKLVGAYPVLGSGLGSYQSALLRFKSAAPMNTVDYAHNDYLQAAAEAGIPGVLVGLVLVAIVCGRAFEATRLDDARRYVGLGCVAALAAILLHSLVDFNLYIPSNAMLLAWIAGVAMAL